MKKIILTTALSFAILMQVSAQSKIVINEVFLNMTKGQQTGFEVLIPESKPKVVNSEFGKLFKKYKGKVISSKKSPETFVDDASIIEVSENTIDVYFITSPINNGTKLLVFVDLGGVFISSSSHTRAYDAMEVVLRQFGLDASKGNIKDQIKMEEKNLANLNKELSKLAKEKNSDIKKIENYKSSIEKIERNISNIEDNYEKKIEQINIQKEINNNEKNNINSSTIIHDFSTSICTI